MPTYEYQCAKGHAFEVSQRISERPKSKCPACGAKATRIISGGAALIFKGSGFYITDYGKDGKGPRKDAGSGEPPAAVPPTPAVAASASGDPTPKATGEVPAKTKKKSPEKATE